MPQTRSLAHRKAISDSLRGQPKSPAHRAAIGRAIKGKRRTTQHRAEAYANSLAQRHSPFWWQLYERRLGVLEYAHDLESK